MPKTITVYGLRANLRQVLDELAATQEPVILAARGRRPVAVLVTYSAWRAAQEAAPADAVERQLAAARAQVAQLTAELAAARTHEPDRAPENRPGEPAADAAGIVWGISNASRWGQTGG
jgi:prevent-host-death family protein